jgi:hypothetical protein
MWPRFALTASILAATRIPVLPPGAAWREKLYMTENTMRTAAPLRNVAKPGWR